MNEKRNETAMERSKSIAMEHSFRLFAYERMNLLNDWKRTTSFETKKSKNTLAAEKINEPPNHLIMCRNQLLCIHVFE